MGGGVSGKTRESVATAETGVWDVSESHLVRGQCRHLVSSFPSPIAIVKFS